MMPSTGETSEKSRPTASTIWSPATIRSLVGSKSTQPSSSPHHRGARRRPARHRDARARVDAQIAVRDLDHDTLGQGAEEIAPDATLRGARTDLDMVRDQLLAMAAPRLQPQRAAGEADRTLI